MFEVKSYGTNRLDVSVSGKIDAEEMKEGIAKLIDHSEGMENGRMRYTVEDTALQLPTPGAIKVELSALPRMLRLMRRFDRIAVLADQRWLRTASEFEGRLIPGLEIRAFGRADLSAAEAWLSD